MRKHIIGPIALAAALLAHASVASATPVTYFSATFDTENNGDGALNYNGFAQFTVTDGTVDLIGDMACNSGTGFGCASALADFLPGNGLYVDLDGSTKNAGVLTATSTLLPVGKFILSFDLAGSQVGTVEQVWARVFDSGGTVIGQQFTLASADGFKKTVLLFSLDVSDWVSFSFENIYSGIRGDNSGALLDDVELLSTPEPGSMMLLGTGLFGLAGAARRRFVARRAK